MSETNAKIQKYLKIFFDTGYDSDFAKAYYQYKLIKKFSTPLDTNSADDKLTEDELTEAELIKFSTLAKTDSANDELTKAVTASVNGWCVPQIKGMSLNLLVTLIVLLQSVTLSKVSTPTEKMPSRYGVKLHFSDDLQTSDNLKISGFLPTTEPNDKAVVAHVSMMQTILHQLYRTYELIAFYYIYRNNEEVLSKDERYLPSFRLSIFSPKTTETPETPNTPDSPKTPETTETPGSLLNIEVRRIVYRIFTVSDLKFDTQTLTEVTKQVISQRLPHMGGIGIDDKILTSLIDFLKEVEDSDIMLDTPTTITLTLHDKIKLIQRVNDKYCEELLQFLGLMGVLCNVCNTKMRKINRNISVKYTIPQGSMNSLSKSVKSCPKAAAAAAEAAAEAAAAAAAAAAAKAAAEAKTKADADAAAAAQIAATASLNANAGGDGRTPRRKHARKTNRKHNRKTRHKRAHKTCHKRKHRSRAARKHKKYSRKR